MIVARKTSLEDLIQWWHYNTWWFWWLFALFLSPHSLPECTQFHRSTFPTMHIITQKSSSDPVSLQRSGKDIPVHQRGEEEKGTWGVQPPPISFLPLRWNREAASWTPVSWVGRWIKTAQRGWAVQRRAQDSHHTKISTFSNLKTESVSYYLGITHIHNCSATVVSR